MDYDPKKIREAQERLERAVRVMQRAKALVQKKKNQIAIISNKILSEQNFSKGCPTKRYVNHFLLTYWRRLLHPSR